MEPEKDRLPTVIKVWACPQCGYWRQEKSSGVHVDYPTRASKGERHELVPLEYRRV
jgi:hypothetical protein